jgi:uncharacterized membrane protein YedE/YeeE
MIVALVCGIIFALIAQSIRLNTFDKIISTALLRSTEVIQILLFAIAVSSIAFFIEYQFGGATVEVKPFLVVGVMVGGLLFGAGIAILGYCPGTMTMALAEGKVDALFGYVGGILAGLMFTVVYPVILPMLGPNYGAINLYSENNVVTGLVVSVYATALILIALKLNRSEAK